MSDFFKTHFIDKALAILCLCILSAVVGCNQATPQEATIAESTPDTASPTSPPPTSTPSPAATVTPAATTPASATPPASTPTGTPSPVPSATPTTAPSASINGSGDAVIVDHSSLDHFPDIPDEYIDAASQLRFLVRHASVGHNIDNALNCLMDDSGNPPNFCDRGLQSEQIVHDAKYDRSNWNFEFHATPNANPGWYNKVGYFIERADELNVNQNYDAMWMILAYLDGAPGSSLDDTFFNREEDNQVGIVEIEAMLDRHPNTQMIWSTLALARIIGGADSDSYNRQLRDYVRANGGYLLDVADIESHTPDGNPCLQDGFPVLCPQYTEETEGGHPNALGSQRIARALWILMARFAGWQDTP